MAKNKKVVDMVRGAITSAAKKAVVAEAKARGMAADAEKRWRAYKPQRDSATASVKKAADSVTQFSRDVAEGVRLGLQDVRKRTSKK